MDIENRRNVDIALHLKKQSDSTKAQTTYINLLLFLGPLERVSIPIDANGKIKTFGFVTFKHLVSVDFALNIFSGTKLFGRELLLKNRNANRNRDYHSQQTPPNSLVHGLSSKFFNCYHQSPNSLPNIQQQLIQQQLVMLATGQNVQSKFFNPDTPLIEASSGSYASTRTDSTGSQREHYVDRNRYHREDNRSNRSKPYRRSRSRSPRNSHRNRDDRSPTSSHSSSRQHSRFSDNKNDRSNYHRWGKH